MARRKRCSGPCGQLYDPSHLQRVGGRDALCPDCLLAEAAELAPADSVRDLTDSVPDRTPEPLPLRDEEERFEGLIEYAVDGWPLRRGRLSASALQTFVRCPEQFRYEQILGRRSQSSGSSVMGTGAHGALEAALRFRMLQGEDAKPEAILDTFDAVYEAAVFREQSRQGIKWGTLDKGKTVLDFDVGRGIGRRAVQGYLESPAWQAIEPVALEEVFAFVVPGVPVPFCGLLDVVTPRSVIDWKFGSQTASAIKPDWRIQARIYGLAKRRPVEFHPTSFAGKAQSPETHPELRARWDATESVIAARMIRSVVNSILLYANGFGIDQPWPGLGVSHTWACGSCGFRGECAWWNVPERELLL